MLENYRTRWNTAALATTPIDRAEAERSVVRAYTCAGYSPPRRIVWCDGPIALATDWDAARRQSNIGGNLRVALLERVQAQAGAAVRAAASRDAWLAVISGGRASLAETTNAEIVRAVTMGVERIKPKLTLSVALRRAIVAIGNFRRDPRLWPSFARSSFSAHDLAWLGTYQYLKDVNGLGRQIEMLDGLFDLGQNAGWLLPHEDVCWLSERQEAVNVDDRGRLHCKTGPALRYRDGWAFYAWKGVEVPEEVIERPGTVTLDRIDSERDITLRRCLIEIMTPKAFIDQGGASLVARDEAGMLWRRSWWNGDAWAAVEVVNGTPEPDGTRTHYVLQVPAEIRTPRAAVAWTYGLSDQQYSRLVLRT